jgi:hypothetical protein
MLPLDMKGILMETAAEGNVCKHADNNSNLKSLLNIHRRWEIRGNFCKHATTTVTWKPCWILIEDGRSQKINYKILHFFTCRIWGWGPTFGVYCALDMQGTVLGMAAEGNVCKHADNNNN